MIIDQKEYSLVMQISALGFIIITKIAPNESCANRTVRLFTDQRCVRVIPLINVVLRGEKPLAGFLICHTELTIILFVR